MSELLTPAMLRILRAAESVTFHLSADRDGEPLHLLCATRSVWLGDVYCLPRSEWPIAGRVVDYSSRGADVTAYRGSAVLYAGVSSGWPTIARLLRAGDRLTAEWVVGRDTRVVDEVIYHRDEVWLEVARDGQSPMRFLLDATFTPDNVMRLVRNEPWAGAYYAALDRGVDDCAEQLAAALPARFPARMVLLTPSMMADRLPETFTVSGAQVRVVVDAQRFSDEVVLTDAKMRRLVARTIVVPPNVTAAGRDAQTAYRRLRASGVLPIRAVNAAVAIGLPAAA